MNQSSAHPESIDGKDTYHVNMECLGSNQSHDLEASIVSRYPHLNAISPQERNGIPLFSVAWPTFDAQVAILPQNSAKGL